MTELMKFIFSQPFLRHALAAALLSSIACGVIGTFVVVKRISYLGGGIAHAVLGGLGLAVFLGIPPLAGALGAAISAALLIGWVTLRFRQHEDTAISAIWAIGMATGIVFISITPGYNTNLLSYLFGNILMVTSGHLMLLAVLDIVIAVTVALVYHQLVAVAFDQEYASIRGIRADALYLLILCMVALTVVILIQTVGLILVIALMTLPASIARLMTRSVGAMMLLAATFSFIFTLTGLAFSFTANIPTGASIILVAGVGYLSALTLSAFMMKRKSV